MARLKKASIALLSTIAAAMTANPAQPFAFVSKADADELIKNKFVAVNDAVTDPADASRVAMVLNDDGKAEHAKHAAKADAPVVPRAPVDPNSFTRQRIAAIPERPRGGAARVSIYPFDELGAPDASGYDSFLITPTEARPTPHKTLVSTVSGATKRWAKTAAKDTTGATIAREFSIVAENITDGEHAGKIGARVVRTK